MKPDIPDEFDVLKGMIAFYTARPDQPAKCARRRHLMLVYRLGPKRATLCSNTALGDPMTEGKTVLCLSALLFALTTVIASAQHRPTYPHPPAQAQPQASPRMAAQRSKSSMDELQLGREAREMAGRAKTLPTERQAVRGGLLAQDP